MSNRCVGRAAVVLTDDCFRADRAAAARNLVRGGDRFDVRVVVDRGLAGRDTRDVLDGVDRAIPIVADVAAALRHTPEAEVAVVGLETEDGRLTAGLRAQLCECARAGMDVVSGLYERLADDIDIAMLAAASGGVITDLRRTPPARQLRFWDGSVYTVRADRIAVISTDGSVAKRRVARPLAAALPTRGLRTEVIHSDLVGWLHGSDYGSIYDALPGDFTAGELERAILSCANDIDPDVMLIEGGGSLRDPSGSFGTGLIISAAVSGVILEHGAPRERYPGLQHLPHSRTPSLAADIGFVRRYGAPVLAVAVDLDGVEPGAAVRVVDECRAQTGDIPVIELRAGGQAHLAALVSDWVRSCGGC